MIVFQAKAPGRLTVEMVKTSTQDYTIREVERDTIKSQVNGYSLQSGACELARMLREARFHYGIDYRQTVDRL